MKSGTYFFLNSIQEKKFSKVLLLLGIVSSILILSLLNAFISNHLTENELSQGLEMINSKP
ncbi:MAG: hypothetical protein ACXACP_10675, partial [Candidatus Hodarchaeales archaeon]